ncbi:MAG: YfhO family protein [SAR324 cluster bacterium]|nr:YfhO family protein [SAR324 cluster bacterium]
MQLHWKNNWAKWIIVCFVLFQFGDVFFGQATLGTLQNSPAGWVYEIPKYHGLFEGGSLNRFPRKITSHRALWDQPLVNDPVIKASNEILLSGEFPWINPYLGLGIPLFGNGVDSTFFVGTMLMAFLNSIYWDWVYLGFFLISGLLLFQVFHRYYGLESSASLVGVLLYLSSALFAPQMVNGGESFNIYCFTIGVFFIEVFRSAEKLSKKLASALAIILCVTQSAYAAMSEGTVATYIMLCTYLLLRLKLWPYRFLWKTGLWIFGIFSISLLLSAPYLLTLQYNSEFMPHGHIIGHITIPLRYFPDLFLPYFRGWAQNDFFPGTFPNQLNVVFVGIVPLIAFALWISHYFQFEDKIKWLGFFLIILFYIAQSFGPEQFNLNFVGKIPIINLIWFWRFFPALFVFSVSLLSAKVLHDLHTGKIPLLRYRFIVLLGMVVTGYFYLLNYWAAEIAVLQNDPSFALRFVKWNTINTTFVCLFPLLFLFWTPWFQKQSWWPQFRKYWGALLIGMVFLYSSYNFSKTFYHQQDAFEPTPGIVFLKNKLRDKELFRIYSPNVYFPSTASGYGIPDIRYMAPVVPKNVVNVLNSTFGEFAKDRVWWDRFESLHELTKGATYDNPGFDILNVRYFPFGKNHPNIPTGPNFRRAYQDDHIVIVENLNVKERAFLVSDWQVFPDEKELLETIQNNPQNLARTAFLLRPPAWPDPKFPPAAGSRPPKLLERTNQGYRMEIQLHNPQMLVISDAYYEGYKAYIGDQEIPVQEVNGGLIGLALPAGKYQLNLRFEHPFYSAILLLFISGLFLVLGTALIAWMKFRQGASDKAQPVLR